jgi:uncharacterized protein
MNVASERRTTRNDLTGFYILSVALSWPALFAWRLPVDFNIGAAREAYAQVGLFFAFGPMLAALVMSALRQGLPGLRQLLSALSFGRAQPSWYVVALLLPLIPQWVGIAAWLAVTGDPVLPQSWAVWASRWFQISIFGAAFAVGEELGWRAFMLPRLQSRYPWLRASLIAGVLWAIWHYPIWFAVNRAVTGSLPKTAAILLMASVTAVALSVMVTVLFNRSRGSVLVTMLFHGSINANMNIFYERAGDAAATSLLLVACTMASTLGVAAVIAMATRGAGAEVALLAQ